MSNKSLRSKKVLFLPAFVFLNLLLFAGCSWFTSSAPCNKQLSKEKMVEMMTDIFLLEAHLGLLPSQSSGRDSIHEFYAGLFQKYNITPEEFEKTLECYLLDRALMNQLLDESINQLSIARSRADEKKEEEEKPREIQEQLPMSPE